MIKLTHDTNKKRLTEKAAWELNDLFKRHKSKKILFLSSGGSALKLVEKIETELLGPHITISVLDERYSKDHAVNNFAQLQNTNFYKKAKAKGSLFIDTTIHNDESLENLATRFESGLRAWKNKNKDGIVIITQGIGADGHTAGIIPYPENPQIFKRLFINEKKWVVSYNTWNKNPYRQRITTTIPFLCNVVHHSIVFAAGKEKQHAIQMTLACDGELWETPACVIHEMKEVYLYTDYHNTT